MNCGYWYWRKYDWSSQFCAQLLKRLWNLKSADYWFKRTYQTKQNSVIQSGKNYISLKYFTEKLYHPVQWIHKTCFKCEGPQLSTQLKGGYKIKVCVLLISLKNFTIRLNESTKLVLLFATFTNIKREDPSAEHTGPRRWSENLSMHTNEDSWKKAFTPTHQNDYC